MTKSYKSKASNLQKSQPSKAKSDSKLSIGSKAKPQHSVTAKSQPSKSLHPRNLHNSGYDFPALVAVYPRLKAFVKPNPYGNLSIDFADPLAVKMLNAALLKLHYSVDSWDIPEGFLCPPIPGRADYIHYVADLLAVKKTSKKRVPKGPRVRVLDIGTGANVIYPLLGIQSYGWDFVGSDVDPLSIANAQQVFASNPAIAARFNSRLQTNAKHVFHGVIEPNERFDLTLCNPPFHASLAEASEGTARKLKNLAANRAKSSKAKPLASTKPVGTKTETPLNFGGQKAELWCEGGELQFLQTMISESHDFASQCLWFTTLVSKKENLKPAKALLAKLKAEEVKEIEMHQGNKITRVLAWTFLNPEQRELWQQYRDMQS
ncbi:23S rRNA (adenine(1618)-N(6))-methyltransferase RlmF [Shewanella schlegeliana]|uniref:Ribosomal RNA large subunit methyltransferase F n=1 Tax=Shewanella schlegeliana TaxID=190308 RepID=A0ABS1T418_9GAMM|nr:23S rRNA (adenine(1618)-N(6))-methyltransferase RlmF [Shewanella schlegeliana]MBL4915444.1 23S rRNA (adenine(1618)-N(6))-methyltransferase RlmF [Shewanella schlegeliana]MCL1110032.1 23S rRNA (adenine(1618)-N(6))-methyltransferase RlmF [Shewanella schlegeliana]GIU25140.1 ribosomal RNA large subunit methyltransferase F [Shewanella schlegeliana]